MRIRALELDKQLNRYFANELAFYVRPYYLVVDNQDLNPNHPSKIVVLANSWSPEVRMRCIYGGAFEGAYLTSTSADTNHDFLVTLRNITRAIPYTGQPCHIRTVFGGAQALAGPPSSPAVLDEAIFLNEKEELGIRFFNLSADYDDEVMPVIMGRMMFPRKVINDDVSEQIRKRILRSRQMAPYFCPLDENPTLTAGQELEVMFSQDAMFHFDVRKIAYSIISDEVADFKFRVIDEYGQELTNNWIRAGAAAGTAIRPFKLCSPWVIRAGGKLRFIIESLNDDYSMTIYFTLIGRQFFT